MRAEGAKSQAQGARSYAEGGRRHMERGRSLAEGSRKLAEGGRRCSAPQRAVCDVWRREIGIRNLDVGIWQRESGHLDVRNLKFGGCGGSREPGTGS